MTVRRLAVFFSIVAMALFAMNMQKIVFLLTMVFTPASHSVPELVDPLVADLNVGALILDLGGDGIELTPLDQSSAYFDFDGNGFAERTGWVNADDGFLVMDRNGNGKIDDISELFGGAGGHANGFANLATIDNDGNGILDASDAGFSQLQIWRDLNHDGVTDAGELFSLSEFEIASINLTAGDVALDVGGSTITQVSTVTFTNGSTSEIADVYFDRDTADTHFLLDDSFVYDPNALIMPELWGRGNVANASIALSLDATLQTKADALLGLLENGDIAQFQRGFEGFLLDWTGASSADVNGRGSSINGQHLAMLEAFYGTGFVQTHATNGTEYSNPNAAAAGPLEGLYQDFANWYAVRFMIQSVGSTARAKSTTIVGMTNRAIAHPLTGLVGLLDGYGLSDQYLNGSLADVIRGLNYSVENGSLTAENAALVVGMLENGLGQDGVDYSTIVSNAFRDAEIPETSDFRAATLFGETLKSP